MKTFILMIFISISIISCSMIPTGTNRPDNVNLDGTWQSTYMRPVHSFYEGGPTEFEQTSTLNINGDQFSFTFDPPTPQSILHFDILEEISGTYTINDNLISFYHSTGETLIQELIFSFESNSLNFSYPILGDTLDNGAIVYVIPLGTIPWGYAMNVWESFVKVK